VLDLETSGTTGTVGTTVSGQPFCRASAGNPEYFVRRSDIESWGETQRQDSGRFGGDGAFGLVEALARIRRWPPRPFFPGVSLEALQFLHEEREILFHGDEPLDTTPNLEAKLG
jgi:hypothetical protein